MASLIKESDMSFPIVHHIDDVQIYFGDASDNVVPAMYQDGGPLYAQSNLFCLDHAVFGHLRQYISCRSAMFLRQTHSTKGMLVDGSEKAFVHEGDYLITRELHVAIGVMTADCMPVVAYDPVARIIGIAHAGWRGAVEGVVLAMLEHMKLDSEMCSEQLHIFLGPAAGVCCYEVDDAFIKMLPGYALDCVVQRNEKSYFNMLQHNKQKLLDYGVFPEKISSSFHVCTICNDNFCSHRRQGIKAGRQMTMVCMR